MKEIDAITQTLDTLMTVDFPRLIILFGVLLIVTIIIIVIVFWRISNNSTRMDAQARKLDSQQWLLFSQTMTNLNEYLKTEQGVNRTILTTITDEIRINAQMRKDNHTVQNAAIEGIAKRLSEFFKVMDNQLEVMQTRLVEFEMQITDSWKQANIIGQELKRNMDEVKNGNGKTLAELQEIRREMKRLTDLVETAINDLTTTVNQLSKPHTTPTTSEDTKPAPPDTDV